MSMGEVKTTIRRPNYIAPRQKGKSKSDYKCNTSAPYVRRSAGTASEELHTVSLPVVVKKGQVKSQGV